MMYALTAMLTPTSCPEPFALPAAVPSPKTGNLVLTAEIQSISVSKMTMEYGLSSSLARSATFRCVTTGKYVRVAESVFSLNN